MFFYLHLIEALRSQHGEIALQLPPEYFERTRPTYFLQGRLAGNPSNRKQIVSKCRVRHLNSLGIKFYVFTYFTHIYMIYTD